MRERVPLVFMALSVAATLALGGAIAPLLLRIDRFWLGMAALVLSSQAMAALVLFTYFTA
jgi:hypothetical protein